jgi:hypothetical protein
MTTIDDFEPGHPDPMGLWVKGRPTDDLVTPTQPATLLCVHGTPAELILTCSAINDAGWPVLNISNLVPCQPGHGCFHLDVIVGGDRSHTDITRAISHLTAAIATSTAPPYPILGAHLN